MDKVCKLKKVIYSLNQSPQVWFNKFNIAVAHYGLRWSYYDYSIFVRHFSADTFILVIYIDDIVFTEYDH